MDFTVENGWMCSQNSNWSKEVKSTSGHNYVVSFGPILNKKRRTAHDWTCTCPDFIFRKQDGGSGYCKHILKCKKERCHWHTQFSGPDEPIMVNNEPRCPLCHSRAIPIQFAT